MREAQPRSVVTVAHVHDARSELTTAVLDVSDLRRASEQAVVEKTVGGPARALDIVTPGGLENYYEELARIADAPDVFERVASMEERFGIHMDWDSIATLSLRYGLRMAAS